MIAVQRAPSAFAGSPQRQSAATQLDAAKLRTNLLRPRSPLPGFGASGELIIIAFRTGS